MNKGFNFAILQESGTLIERLHRSLIGFDKTREPSLRKRPESPSNSAALQTSVLFDVFFVEITVVCVKQKTVLEQNDNNTDWFNIT